MERVGNEVREKERMGKVRLIKEERAKKGIDHQGRQFAKVSIIGASVITQRRGEMNGNIHTIMITKVGAMAMARLTTWVIKWCYSIAATLSISIQTVTQTIGDIRSTTDTTKYIKAVSGKRHQLKGTESAKAVTTHKKYIVLTDDDGNGDSDDDHGNNTIGTNWALVGYKSARLNNRQRAEKRMNMQMVHFNNNHDDEAIKDAAAAANRIPESEWTGIRAQKCNGNDYNNRPPPRRHVRFCIQNRDNDCVHDAVCTDDDDDAKQNNHISYDKGKQHNMYTQHDNNRSGGPFGALRCVFSNS